MKSGIKFSKFQGAGNDFVLIDARNVEQDWSKLAQTMCDRHFGIGADGLILVQNSNIADLKMRIFNPDGSEGETCGNGLRCFTRYAIEKGIVDKASLAIETLAGMSKANVCTLKEKVSQVQVSLVTPRFQPEQIPISVEVDTIPILNYPLEVEGRILALSLLSVGVPHAVNFISEPVSSFPLSEVGPEVENHPLFPRRINFDVARVLNKGKIEARVWERGVNGETLACGSGSCAIAVAAQLLGYIDKKVDVAI